MIELDIVLHATSRYLLEKGLMNTNQINNNECALFSFDTMSDHRFWNKNVAYDIDVLFLDPNKNILSIKRLEANQVEPVKSGYNFVSDAIEVNSEVGDMIRKNNYKIVSIAKNKITLY